MYSGPSGRFGVHIDTPCSRRQFGSLVVCLPVEHKGGQLKVRHEGEEMTFDWSTSRDNRDHASIRWAAFYSDCEHEVLEVTSGHRITLTYNLYAISGTGRLTGMASPAVDPTHLPLFQTIKAILDQDPFGGQGDGHSHPSLQDQGFSLLTRHTHTGGCLGFPCTHFYPYNNEAGTPLPDTLKGVDAVLWETFQALGFDPEVAPVMKLDNDDREEIMKLCENPAPPTRANTLVDSLASPPYTWIIGHNFGLNTHRVYWMDTIEDQDNFYQSWGYYNMLPILWFAEPKQWELQVIYRGAVSRIPKSIFPVIQLTICHRTLIISTWTIIIQPAPSW